MRALLLLVLVACVSTPASMHTDPDDPAAWKDAELVAASEVGGRGGHLVRRSEGLPFLFVGDDARCVLVHRGRVVRERGPGVAAAYLRDLGIARGPVPSLNDVLFALWALDGLPRSSSFPSEGYVDVPGSARLADLTARVERDGRTARVVLHYFVSEAARPAGVVAGSGVRRPRRSVVRMTLEIRELGEASWRREDVSWVDPG